MKRTSGKRQGYAAEQRRRLEAGKLFAKGWSQAEVARGLGVSRQSASRWQRAWESGGAALAGAGRTGRPRKLSGDELCQLEAALLAGAKAQGFATELWTLARIAEFIRRKFRTSYHPSHVWRILGELGWSCQRPEKRARERDDEAIAKWVRHRWPQIKKRPARLGRSSYSSTKAGFPKPPACGEPGRRAVARRSSSPRSTGSEPRPSRA